MRIERRLSRVRAALPMVALLAGSALPLEAQDYYSGKSASPSPLLTGALGSDTILMSGEQTASPQLAPILLLPLGRKALIEAEAELRLDLARENGERQPNVFSHDVEYLQLDWLVHPRLTLTAGRFLTPFGIYRERVHPIWIRNLVTEPIIFAMNESSSNGLMMRGAVPLAQAVNVTYSGFYSAATERETFFAEKQAGGRASLVFPSARLELGGSYSRKLGDERYNMFGADLTWIGKGVPLDLRAEALSNADQGKGYWVEGAYRLSSLGRSRFLRNSRLIVRAEQFWLPDVVEPPVVEPPVEGGEPMTGEEAGDEHAELPDRNTTRFTFGYSYSLPNGLHVNAAYGRNHAVDQNYGLWSFGISYRFAIY